MEEYPDPVCLCDAEDRIVFINRAFLALNPGLEHLLEPGRGYMEHLAAALAAGAFPDKSADPEGWIAERLAVRRRGGEFEVRRAPDRWLLVRDIRLPDGATLTLCLDITARKRAEQALAESEARYRMVSERMLDGILILQDARIVHANPAIERLTGFALDELIGREFGPLVHPDDRAMVAERHRRRMAGDAFEPRYDIRILTRAGEPVWVQISNARIEWRGRPAVLTVVSDLRERKRAEQALREAYAELEESQARARLGSWTLYPDRWTGHWSAQMYRIFGRDPALGPPPFAEFLRLVHPEDRRLIEDGLREAIRGRATAAFDFRTDPAVLPLRYLTATVNATFRADADRPVVTGTVQDITERKLAEQAIRQLNETLEQRVRERTAELEAALAELESFSYSVSHDLRAPLRAMAGFAHMVIEDEGERLSAEGRRKLAVVEKNAVRMGELVDDLLTLARVSRAGLVRSALDIERLVRALATELAPRYPAAEIVIGALPPGEGDETLLRQALLNLLENALKYSARAERPRVEVGWDEAAGAYFVRDNGVGFDMAYAPKLFRPFERLHPESEFPGTGIGLAIVRRVIERHGGRVWGESAPGAGAVFRFTLRAAP
jgi:hypothetical protein